MFFNAILIYDMEPMNILSTFVIVGIISSIFFNFSSVKNSVENVLGRIRLKFLSWNIHFRRSKKRRFYKWSKENFSLIPSVCEIGIISSPSERSAERRRTVFHENDIDGVIFWGADWNQNELIAKVIRRVDNVAEVWLLLRINGKLYQLPSHPETRITFVDPSNEKSFKAGGLHLQCQWPMRQWRISFNGLLKSSSDSDKNNVVHFKFSFLWKALSCINDDLHDFENSSFASALETNFVKFALEKSKNSFDNYEQWGMLCGTVMFGTDNEEKELWMWGSRRRLMGQEYPKEEKIRLDISMKDGMKTSLEIKNIPGILKNFSIGHCHYKNFCEYPITACMTNLMDIAKKMSLNSEFDFIFKTAKSVKIHTMAMRPINGSGVSLEGVIHRNILYTFQVKFEDVEGLALLQHSFGDLQNNQRMCIYPPLLLFDKEIHESALVVTFEDIQCQSSGMVGGKGLSLGLLTALSNKFPQKFTVPKGCVLTTIAYQQHINHKSDIADAIDLLKETLSKNVREEVEDACKRVTYSFENSDVDDIIKEALVNILMKQFGEKYEDKLFAIRSSACGEDGEELSAAGQMSTLLGVKGLSSIFASILTCWASHFKYESVQYLRQNGKLITSPMAVVIQEMVKAETAGVLFTVHPVTNDPSFMVLTANYGLGESVVSARSEPDTITLRRLPLRHINCLEIHHVEIGSKKTKIVLENIGTEEKEVDIPSATCCSISNQMALKLGEIGLLIEDCFCSERDIEWAIKDGNIFLLQARPITTLDIETEFELIHDQDSAIPTDNEYVTLANTGEVFPYACCPLTLSTIVTMFDRCVEVLSKMNLFESNQAITYNSIFFSISHRRMIFNFLNLNYRYNLSTRSTEQKIFDVSVFGRVLDDKCYQTGVNRYGYTTKIKKFIPNSIILIMFVCGYLTKQCEKKNPKKFVDEISVLQNSEEIYHKIIEYLHLLDMNVHFHTKLSLASARLNCFLFTILEKENGEWNDLFYTDVGNLISSCQNVESADVPRAIKELSESIKEEENWKEFISMSPGNAATWLEKNEGITGQKYKKFLEIHGHRGIQELDFYFKPWRINPEGLVASLQASVQNIKIKDQIKNTNDIDDTIANIKTPIGFFSKFLLSYLVPHCRKAVAAREDSKSKLTKCVDVFRSAFEKLGNRMVLEGRLPSSDLLYFLSIDEIWDLIETRSSNLIFKAIKRQKLTSKLNANQFPEIINGIPRPLNIENMKDEMENKTVQLKGTAVSHGIVTAKARIVLDIEEAKSILAGEILVCKTTDIAWSPYFPILAGLVTEYGGLISHGVVIAREYGLPCLTSVKHATQILKTGDIVQMDTTKGVINRLEK